MKGTQITRWVLRINRLSITLSNDRETIQLQLKSIENLRPDFSEGIGGPQLPLKFVFDSITDSGLLSSWAKRSRLVVNAISKADDVTAEFFSGFPFFEELSNSGELYSVVFRRHNSKSLLNVFLAISLIC